MICRALARLVLSRLPAAPGTADLVITRDEVHQASGIVSVQRGMGVDEALDLLRTFAVENDRLLVT